MKKVLKNIGFFVLALVITLGIYWIVYMDRESKQDVLESALGLLGNDLMVMIPDGIGKKSVQDLYNKFLQQTAERKVTPEQVEYVAAGILNLKNIDTTITPEQAEAILNLSINAPLKVEMEKGPPIPTPQIPEEAVSQARWEDLGERIKSLYEFNSNFQKSLPKFTDEQKVLQRQICYRVDKNLKVTIDANLKKMLEQKKFERLAKELHKMEKNHILQWQDNFQEELNREMELMKHQLESLKELHELNQLKVLQNITVLKSLESLKCLESLKYITVINADSIHAIVERSLKEAGIDTLKMK